MQKTDKLTLEIEFGARVKEQLSLLIKAIETLESEGWQSVKPSRPLYLYDGTNREEEVRVAFLPPPSKKQGLDIVLVGRDSVRVIVAGPSDNSLFDPEKGQYYAKFFIHAGQLLEGWEKVIKYVHRHDRQQD